MVTRWLARLQTFWDNEAGQLFELTNALKLIYRTIICQYTYLSDYNMSVYYNQNITNNPNSWVQKDMNFVSRRSSTRNLILNVPSK